MKEQALSQTYARAMMELGKKRGVRIVEELEKVLDLVENHRNLGDVFYLDVFTVEEKCSVFSRIAERISLNKIVGNFIRFLFSEKRIYLLPSIYGEVVVLDDWEKGIIRGTIEGRDASVNSDLVGKIKDELKRRLKGNIELTYRRSNEISAGYRVTMKGMMLDASLDHQLQRFKKPILSA